MGIAVHPDLERRIAAQVESGRYRTTDEVIQDGLDLLEARNANGAPPQEEDGRSISEIIMQIGREVPEDAWRDVPTDLAKNLDHYFYGAPKESE